MNVCDEFAVTVMGDAGLVDVPVGRPEIDTETDPLNPFFPATETVTGTLVLPCAKLTEVDENNDVTEIEKSGGIGGGGGDTVKPPPQATVPAITLASINGGTRTTRRGDVIGVTLNSCV